MRYPGFVNGSYESQSPLFDAESTVNWYPERAESEGAVSQWALYPTPGVQKIATSKSGPGRAHFAIAGREFAVEGTSFVEISRLGVQTVRGEVSIGSNPATISYNGDGGGQLLVTSGGNAYCYDMASHAFAQVTALDGKATMGDSLDGYFLVLDASNSTFYLSDLLDGLTWDPTMFAQRTIAPDPWISLVVNGRYVFLHGTQTSEVWYDSGQGNFPFAPHPSGLMSFGIAGSFARAVADGQLVWLSQTRVGEANVLRATGFTPEPVANYALQYAFGNYDTIEDAVIDAYSEAGHLFFVLTFPTEDITWAWDAQLNKWHRRGTWISEENRFRAWRPRWHALAFGEHRMLDSETGGVYRMAIPYGLDVDGRPLRRVRRGPTLSVENQLIFYSSFELNLEPGLGLPPHQSAVLPIMDETEALAVGLIPGVDFVTSADAQTFIVNPTTNRQGWDPQVMLRFSDDGGKTWSTEMMRGAGKSGEWYVLVQWFRLGAARRRIFEISTSDPIPFRIMDAFLGLGQPIKGAERAVA